MLQIPAELFQRMIAHAQQEFPLECCGLLAGTGDTASRLFSMRNELSSPFAYSADPRDLLSAHREMRAGGIGIVAIYHSHPHTEAKPSRRDLAENFYGDVPRIIVSLAGAAPVVKCFVLCEDRFEEIECRSIPKD
jgi:proteasome lid subunit RPN8/RPN11